MSTCINVGVWAASVDWHRSHMTDDPVIKGWGRGDGRVKKNMNVSWFMWNLTCATNKKFGQTKSITALPSQHVSVKPAWSFKNKLHNVSYITLQQNRFDCDLSQNSQFLCPPVTIWAKTYCKCEKSSLNLNNKSNHFLKQNCFTLVYRY